MRTLIHIAGFAMLLAFCQLLWANVLMGVVASSWTAPAVLLLCLL